MREEGKEICKNLGILAPSAMDEGEGSIPFGCSSSHKLGCEGEGKVQKIIYDYDGWMDVVAKNILDAEEEFLISTGYIDYRVLDAILKRKDQIKIKSVMRELDALEISEIFLSPDEIRRFANYVQANNRLRNTVPLSFFLRDQKRTGLEVKNPIKPKDFFVAFLIERALGQN